MDHEGKIKALFKDIGRCYHERNVADTDIYTNGHDIHAFYRLRKQPSSVVHVQGYPGFSTSTEARVLARLMDYDAMQIARQDTKVSIGNEHDAVVRHFPNFTAGVTISYDPKVLEAMIGENISELA